MSELPLSGVRVVEFSHMVMGPSAGVVLADMGADVIKVEPAGKGDNTRRLTGSGAGFFAGFNRNKRSIALDLKNPEGHRIALDLIRKADVLIENFRPGALEKLGFGYDALQTINPGLIYCSAKGFLPGPYEDRTALDEVVQMMGGLAYMTGPPGRPLRAGASVNDILGGMFGALGVLAALRQRDSTGKGQKITSGLFETCAFLVAQHMAQAKVTGAIPQPMPNRLASWGVYDVFDCADSQLFVAVVTDTQWRAFCAAFDLTEMGADPDLATNPQRCHARDRFLPKLREIFAGYDRDKLIEKITPIGIPFAPIKTPVDLFEDQHLVESGGLLSLHDPDRGQELQVPGLPLEFGDRRFGVRRDVPKIGEHGRDVLVEIGYDPADIDRLLANGILSLGE